MKSKLFTLAGLVLAMSSVSTAQNVRVETSSKASFGRDHSYAWSEEKKTIPLIDLSMADEVVTQLNLHLTSIGLWPDQGCAPDVLVVLSRAVSDQSMATGAPSAGMVSGSAAPNVGNFVVELYDGVNKQLLWRGVAENIPISGNSATDKRMMDRTVDRMFVHFPYYRNGWVSAERR
jgi:hypothetical protein